jgi:Tol biopolymer transport system component
MRWIAASGLALLGALGCGRKTVFVGLVPRDGAVVGGGAGGASGMGGAGGAGGNRPPDASADGRPSVACTPDPPPPSPSPTSPLWNCGARCFQDDNVPADTPFGGPVDPVVTNRPALVYPLAGSSHPVNLPDMTLQWRRAGAAQTAFRFRVSSPADPTRRYELRLPCRQPPPIPTPPAIEECTYPLPRWVWAVIAAENAGAPIELAIDASDRTRVASSSPVQISFTPAALGGGAYYWSDGQSGILRGLLGGGIGQPFINPRTTANRFSCGGCHAASRDGRVISFVAEQDGFLTASRADNPSAPILSPPEPPQPDASTMTLNRDGTLVLVSYGSGGSDGRIVVRETAGGREVARLDPAVLGTPERKLYFPDWSPDGTEIVATLASAAERPWAVNDGALVVIPYAGGAFGRARTLVPREGALFHFYPSFSPDGAWVVFASAPLPGKSYGNPQSRLRLVGRDGGPIYELASATQGAGKTSSWPRFLPFRQADCKLAFITFNSRIDYGYLLKNGIAANGGWSQVWLAAIDLRKLPGDPSSAPVWLPFQDRMHANLRATWVEKLQCGPQSPCGEGAACSAGECVPTQN